MSLRAKIYISKQFLKAYPLNKSNMLLMLTHMGSQNAFSSLKSAPFQYSKISF